MGKVLTYTYVVQVPVSADRDRAEMAHRIECALSDALRSSDVDDTRAIHVSLVGVTEDDGAEG